MISDTLNPLDDKQIYPSTMTNLKNGQYQLHSGVENCVESNSIYQIYQALNLKSGQPVIIYSLAFSLKSYPEFNHWKKQFLYYILLLRSVSHPCLPKILDCFEEEGHPYLVYENYSQGISLETLITEQKQLLTPQQTIQYIKQIAQVLKILHQKGLVHHNVQPRSILIDQDRGNIKLINFGFCWNFKPQIPFISAELTNDGYSPLEHYESTENITSAVDLYGLSATFFYLLTTHKPLSAPQRKQIPWTDWQTFAPKFSDSIRQTLLKGLNLSIEQRCQTLDQWFSLITSVTEDNFSVINSQPSFLINHQNPLTKTPENSPKSESKSVTSSNPIISTTAQGSVLINDTIEIKETHHNPLKVEPVKPPRQIKTKPPTRVKPIPPRVKPNHQQASTKFSHGQELKELCKFMLLTAAIALSGGVGFACSLALNRSTEPGETILNSEQDFPPKAQWPIYTNPN